MTEAGWRLPGYVLEERLGAGGSGQVWRARRRSDGELVAVKLLAAVGREQLAAVRAEAAMLTGLEHPHLLRLHEVVPGKSGLALVVELAAGGSLAQLLAVRGRLTPGEVVTAIAPVGAALAYAHNASVVHGDVSAANLLFTEIGRPLLADLGVARLAGEDAPVRSTPAYIDPAVAIGGVPAATSDVFMLGAVALHALTGDPPWPGDSPDEVLAAAAAGDIGDLAARLRVAGVPDGVAEVVIRALEFESDRRPTAAEFALDLRHAADPVAVELGAGGARTDAVAPDRTAFTHLVRPLSHRAVPTRRRLPCSPRLLALAATGLVAVLAVTALQWWPHGPSQPEARRDRPPASSIAPSTAALPATAPSTAVPSATAPPGPLTPAAAARVLNTLDTIRATAFARRDASLLGEVYSAPALRGQDAAMITAIVPRGCGLIGARTDYGAVTVLGQSPTRVTLQVTATLHPSSLQCSGVSAGQAPGERSTRLRVELLRAGDQVRIEAITR